GFFQNTHATDLVYRVVVQQHGGALGNILGVVELLGEDSHWLYVNASAVGELVALFLHLGGEVGLGLEVVGIQRAVGQRSVWKNVVIVFNDVDVDAGFLSQVLIDEVQDVCLWNWAGAYLDNRRVRWIQGSCSVCSRFAAATSGQCECGGNTGDGECEFLAHNLFFP